MLPPGAPEGRADRFPCGSGDDAGGGHGRAGGGDGASGGNVGGGERGGGSGRHAAKVIADDFCDVVLPGALSDPLDVDCGQLVPGREASKVSSEAAAAALRKDAAACSVLKGAAAALEVAAGAEAMACEECAGLEVHVGGFQELLAQRIGALQQLVLDQHARASGRAARATESARRLEAEVKGLREETARLREQLSRESSEASSTDEVDDAGGARARAPKPKIASPATPSTAPTPPPLRPPYPPADALPPLLPSWDASAPTTPQPQLGPPPRVASPRSFGAGLSRHDCAEEISRRLLGEATHGSLRHVCGAADVVAFADVSANTGASAGSGAAVSDSAAAADVAAGASIYAADGEALVMGRKECLHRDGADTDLASAELQLQSEDPFVQKCSVSDEGSSVSSRFRVLATVRESKATKTGTDYSKTLTFKAQQQRAVFPSPDLTKIRVQDAIRESQYNIARLYKQEGWCQALAKNPTFEKVSLVVIVINALWIWVDTDYNNAKVVTEGHAVFQVAEYVFCGFFVCEWFIRFMAFRHTKDAIRNSLFFIDTVLLLLMVFESLVSPILLAAFATNTSNFDGNSKVFLLLRVFRVSRMVRLYKVLRNVQELMIILRGVGMAARSVFFTLCLLLVVIYMFGIGFRNLTHNTEAGSLYFATVPKAMSTLLVYGCFMEDVPNVVQALGQVGVFHAGVFVAFVLLASLLLLNMSVGMLCEVVSVIAAAEKEALAMSFVKQQVQEAWKELDANGDGHISKAELTELLTRPSAARALSEVGVDVVDLVDFAEFSFPEEEERVNLEEFIEVIIRLRGSNKATVKDVVDLRKFIRQEFLRAHDRAMETRRSELRRSPSPHRTSSLKIRQG